MSYSDDVRRQRIIDDRTLRMNGPNAQTHTIGGKMQADSMRANQRSYDSPSFPASNNYSSPGLFPTGGSGGPSSRTGQGRPGGPMFPSVDKAFEKIPGKVYVALGVIGALIGLGASSHASSGMTVLGNAFMGAFAGLIVVPALKTGVKVVLAAVMIGIACLILYLMLQAAK